MFSEFFLLKIHTLLLIAYNIYLDKIFFQMIDLQRS